MQRGYDTNFNVDVVSCRFTGFNRDGKYAKNHAKHHRIAIFAAEDKNVRIKTETFVGSYCSSAWTDNVANDKCDKPKPKGVT
ncbi:hypothetical protein OAI25_04755 [Alphaproteobacteria bacterium]|nr:hypothetical protein [Alphaproteobacteria bacterium]